MQKKQGQTIEACHWICYIIFRHNYYKKGGQMSYLIIKNNKEPGEKFEGKIKFRKKTNFFLLDSKERGSIRIAVFRTFYYGWCNYHVVIWRKNAPIISFSWLRLSPQARRRYVVATGQNWKNGQFVPWSCLLKVC